MASVNVVRETSYCEYMDIVKDTSLSVVTIPNLSIKTLHSLSLHKNLVSLDANGSSVKNIDGLSNLTSLKYLDISNTNVSSLDAIKHLPITRLGIVGLAIYDVTVLFCMCQLEYVKMSVSVHRRLLMNNTTIPFACEVVYNG